MKGSFASIKDSSTSIKGSFIGTAIFIVLIGVLQLRQDDHLSEKSFVDLTKIVLQQLPLISNIIKQFQGKK